MAADQFVSAEHARSLLAYNPNTGAFTWRITRGTAPAGSRAGNLNPRGYVVITIGRRTYRAHRLAFLIQTGEWPVYGVDHINGVKDDNRWANLRDVPDSINIQNKHRPRRGRKHSDLPLGVQRNRYPSENRYLAQIQVDGRTVHLGRFHTAEEASAAYVQAKRTFHEGCTL